MRTLIEGVLPPGEHLRRWNMRDDAGAPVGSGVYFVRLEADGRLFSRRIAVAR